MTNFAKTIYARHKWVTVFGLWSLGWSASYAYTGQYGWAALHTGLFTLFVVSGVWSERSYQSLMAQRARLARLNAVHEEVMKGIRLDRIDHEENMRRIRVAHEEGLARVRFLTGDK